MEYEIYPINELYHHGVRGMKWGIRRYQNKDGSLTKAGKKRYDKEMAKVKAETKKIKNQQRTAAKLKKLDDAKKNLNDLKKGKDQKQVDPNEDIEVRKAKILESRSAKQLYDNAHLFTTNELMAAKTRLELERNIKNLEPATVDKGKEFTNKFVERADQVASTVQSGTKAYNSIARVYNSLFGNKNGASLPLINDNVNSKLDKFKEETEWMKAKNERKKAQEDANGKPKSDLDKLKEETARIDAENKNREAKRASREHDRKDQREAERDAKESASKNKQNDSDNSAKSETKKHQGESDSKVYEGTVEGVGNSSRSDSGYKYSSKNDTVIDAEWYEVTSSSVNRGQSYIYGLLEEPKGLRRR